MTSLTCACLALWAPPTLSLRRGAHSVLEVSAKAKRVNACLPWNPTGSCGNPDFDSRTLQPARQVVIVHPALHHPCIVRRGSFALAALHSLRVRRKSSILPNLRVAPWSLPATMPLPAANPEVAQIPAFAACPAGTYGNARGLREEDECLVTEPGFYSAPGSQNATKCPSEAFMCPGKELDDVNAVPGSAPILLPVGTILHSTEVAAVDCPPGYWCSAGKQIECVRSTYNDQPKQYAASSCRICPHHSEDAVERLGWTTRSAASASPDDCICKIGFYQTNHSCKQCVSSGLF